MKNDTPARVLIIGGGFAGTYTALELERTLRRRRDLEVTLVSAENFLLFTPMLHEVAASDLDMTHIVNPIRKLLRRVRFFCGAVESVDLERHVVVASHGEGGHSHELPYDHLVLAPGSVTNFHGLPGLEERGLTMKSLGDALELRNRVIANLDEADFECAASERRSLCTVVVAGGGFAGVETAASLNDFVHEALRFYPHIDRTIPRIVLVHSGDTLLPELQPKLGRYAEKKLIERGVDVRKGVRVARCEEDAVVLSDGSTIESRTLVWTAGTSPSPLCSELPCSKERGRIVVDECLRVPGRPGVWAAGDCAVVPDPITGRPHPPTAQHAIREGRTLARNILAVLDDRDPRPFRFRTVGQLASLGRRTGVASILGFSFSGFIAWWLWRTIYLSKLPRFEKKVRVALDWTLDLFFSKDLTQITSGPRRMPAAKETRAAEELAAR